MTPEQILDRLCDSVIHNDTDQLMSDIQLFWHEQWDLANVKDPAIQNQHEDELRYALKACFLERMAEIWSQPPKSQSLSKPMSAPAWCEQVPAMEKSFFVFPEEYRSYFENDLVSPIFAKRNILAPINYMFFL